jgi:hypothetical protein
MLFSGSGNCDKTSRIRNIAYDVPVLIAAGKTAMTVS